MSRDGKNLLYGIDIHRCGGGIPLLQGRGRQDIARLGCRLRRRGDYCEEELLNGTEENTLLRAGNGVTGALPEGVK